VLVHHNSNAWFYVWVKFEKFEESLNFKSLKRSLKKKLQTPSSPSLILAQQALSPSARFFSSQPASSSRPPASLSRAAHRSPAQPATPPFSSVRWPIGSTCQDRLLPPAAPPFPSPASQSSTTRRPTVVRSMGAMHRSSPVSPPRS
jgi:hypothetical protein